jgi:hypothetical protein
MTTVIAAIIAVTVAVIGWFVDCYLISLRDEHSENLG